MTGHLPPDPDDPNRQPPPARPRRAGESEPAGRPDARPPRERPPSQAVASLVADVEAAREARRRHTLAVVLAFGEAMAVFALYLGAMLVLRLPPLTYPDPEEIQEGRAPTYVWLQVRPRCWQAPDWARLEAGARKGHPTVKVARAKADEGGGLRVDGVVDDRVAERLRSWAERRDDACLTVAPGPDDYSLLVQARWTPTDRARVEAATAQLGRAGARVRSLTWQPAPLLVVESAAFPERTLTRDGVRRALEQAGLRDFHVEPAGPAQVDDAARQAWRRQAVMPVLLEQRGVLAVQFVAWLCLGTLLLLVLRRRFEPPEEPTEPGRADTWTRLLVAGALAGIALLVVHKRFGLELRPLREMVAEPDGMSTVLALLGYGLALPVAHGLALLGYVQRRLAMALDPRTALVVTAILFPLVPPLAWHVALWWPVALLAGWLVWSTGRLWSGLALTGGVQLAVAWLAFG